MTAPVPDTDEAANFLARVTPEEKLAHLFAFAEGKRIEAASFRRDQEAQLRAWIDERQGKANIYFSVNELKPGVQNRKALKADVVRAHFLHVDVDDPNAHNRFHAFAPPPTAVVFSGGGFQAFWALSEPTENLERVERINAALARKLGGDNCHNIDRIMRLPGTVNVPNAKKRKAGREPTLAYIVRELTEWTRRYSLSDFAALDTQTGLPTPGSPFAVPATELKPVDLDQLPPSVTDEVKAIIEMGDDPERGTGTKNQRFPSRSEAVWFVVCELARDGCRFEQIAGVLLNGNYGIAASVLAKARPNEYAARQATRALERLGSGWPDLTKSGNPRPTLRNAILAFRRMELRFAFNLFTYRKIVEGVPIQQYQGDLSDDACVLLRHVIIEKFYFDPGKDNSREAAHTLSIENPFHPVREYLAKLNWDGVARIDEWLRRYLGAEDTPLNREIGRIVLVAAVRRIRAPGTKFDTILVLEGPQGGGKSTAIKILAGEEYFSDQGILTLDSKAQMEVLEGVWLYEISELEGMSRADTGKVKAFASRAVDQGRPAYGRFKETRPRQVVFIGTTNDDKYLRDTTGNRRFWPLKVGTIDLAGLRAGRDQLWAEAAAREAEGASILLPEELWPAAQEEQEARLEEDPWLDQLSSLKFRARDLVGEFARLSTSTLLSVHLDIKPGGQQQYLTKRLATVMRKLGWDGPKVIRLPDGSVFRGYQRKAVDDGGRPLSWVDTSDPIERPRY